MENFMGYRFGEVLRTFYSLNTEEKSWITIEDSQSGDIHKADMSAINNWNGLSPLSLVEFGFERCGYTEKGLQRGCRVEFSLGVDGKVNSILPLNEKAA